MALAAAISLAGGPVGMAAVGITPSQSAAGWVVESEVTPTTAPSTTPSRAASVTLENQSAGVRTVVVRSVTLPDGGFVSVNDWYGAVLGHTGYLPSGRHENVAVTVSAPLESGQPLVAVALRDTARGTAEHNCTYDVAETGSEEDNPYFANGSLVADTAVVVPATAADDDETATMAANATATDAAPANETATATPCGPTPQG